MIELDEKDVKAVASSRFWRKYRRWILGITLGVFGLVILTVIVTSPESWTRFLIFIPCGLYLGLATFCSVKGSRAEKFLVEEWKKGE